MREEENASDGRYAINVAKTELREGYNNADVERILSVFSDAFTDLSEGFPSFFGPDGKDVLRARLETLFREYEVELVLIIIDINVAGDVALEFGWHVMTLRPKAGGPAEVRRTRYVEGWIRDPRLAWHIVVFIDNIDQEPKLAKDVLRALRARARDTPTKGVDEAVH
jgi:ketosteroid isomerase-like protein